MGRSKVTARRGGGMSGSVRKETTIEVGAQDPIPLEFLELVRALPTADEASETRSEDDRPRKRLKSAEPDIDEVTISRLTLNIVRPIGGEVAYVEELVRQDIGSHVILELRADALAGKSGERQSLVILPRKRSANKTITRTAFALTANQVNNPHLRTVLYVASHVGQSSGRWGDIWCRTTLTVAPHLEDRGSVQLTVDCELKWNATSSLLHLRPRRGLDRALAEHVIDHFFPHCNPAERDQAQQGSLASDASSSSKSSFSPQSFYDAAHVPPTTSRSDAAVLEVPALDATLFPFQQRTVKWMLGREGVGGPRTAEKGAESDERLPFSFTKAEDGDGRPIYVSSLLQVVTRDVEPFQEVERSIRGGILAEEMGLGKTLECIALILLHKREAGDVATLDRRTMVDPESGQELLVSGATLIVTPNSLIGQWMSELRQHAPQLRIVQYEGNHKAGKGDEMLDTLVRSDVVVTTYSTLSHEIHYTEKAPDRKLRAEQKYPTQKSPLVRIHWWRVCLDEAQMIESGVSSAAVVARRIPRANAWGISGTPVKKDIKDLWGLLLFLRYEPFASQYGFWEELCRSHKATFHDLFQKLALRHTKRLVRDEIALPRQHRYVITVPFTAVEEQHYQTLFRQLVHDCGLDVEGNPIEENWDPDDPATLEAMRTALDRLRQTALHPEVGVQNRRALGHRTGGQLRTLEEVLEAMLEQADGAIRTAQRSLLMNQLSQGQLLENSPRVREALAIWDRVRVRAGEIVAECREQLRIEMEKAAEARREKAALLGREPERDNVNEAADDEGGIVNKRVGECRRKLRSALEVEHKAVFFCANAYFQIKTNKDMTEEGSEQFRELERLETEGYDLAKKLRKEILHEAHRKATVLMDKIAATASKQAFATIPEMGQIPYTGLESRATAERLEELGAMLNVQANQLDEWRELAIRLLLLPLVDEERDSVEITGEEYEDSTKMQDELVVYVSVLRATVADRQDTLSGQINERIKYETRTALQMAKNGDGPAPELTLKLFAKRDEVKADPVTKGSLRGVIADLRTLASKLRPDANDGNARARKELFVVQEQLKLAQKQLSEQNKVAVALAQEVDRFTNAMNARVEYYRQLQAVSDMVAPHEGPIGEAEMDNLKAEEQALQQRLEREESKHRYLLHLKESGAGSSEQNVCIICRETFTIGVLTVCGHQFCKECLMLWFKTHHNCPVCKRRLQMSNLHDITLKPQAMKVHQETVAGSSSRSPQKGRSSRTSAIYSEFSAEKLDEIKSIDLPGPSFTTKVDTLVRHLLWLRESDPGAKSIVFSQYADFLSILTHAFSRHRIGYASFDRPNGIARFKDDPAVECFLLHARAHSSGLNLVNASHVFLCEPLLNTAIELQAIARVDRIGQRHETTVWLYIVDGTVEESIYNLSVARRMEHMGQLRQQPMSNGKNAAGPSSASSDSEELSDLRLEAANTDELERSQLFSTLMSADRSLGERVHQNDLWSCLFGHVDRERIRRAENNERLVENPEVRRYLAAEAAERRASSARKHGEGAGRV